VSEKHEGFEDCITWARFRFQDYFHNRIVQVGGSLQHALVYSMPDQP
jgi:hypothetical protein